MNDFPSIQSFLIKVFIFLKAFMYFNKMAFSSTLWYSLAVSKLIFKTVQPTWQA